MRLPAVVALVSALVLAGCAQSSTNTSGFSGEEKAVAQVVADLADDAQRGEAAAICSGVLSAELRERIAEPRSSCPQEMEKVLDDADGFDLEVTEVTVQGDEATARVGVTDRGEDVERTFRLVRESGEWRLSAFG